MKYKILGIIPARSGSKGIKNKNIIKILNKPLIYYTIKRAKEAKLLTDIVCSTDSIIISKVCKKFKVKTILRPKKLSLDKSNVKDALMYTVKEYEKIKKIKLDYIFLLQPTSPSRKKGYIDLVIKKYLKSNANTMVSISKIDEPHPLKTFRLKNNKRIFLNNKHTNTTNRQMLPIFYTPNGEVYIIDRKTLMLDKKIYGNKVQFDIKKTRNSVNINNFNDLIIAKELLKSF